ncbi:MAG: bifunctional hydroxymethylpyrimidine kinase/phosphomethylpyrimidine kinase [Acidobacteria bacterium]|nr:bifunctional hydroxymethylpyrimidine kinase/phosphomethylpyrimidine kinase [Acidobacteriota bacterium]
MGKPVVLTIGGSDSSGSSGIQADLKTFEALGVFGASAITAVTAQNTREISEVHDIPAGIVKAQIRSVLSDMAPRAVKVGLLTTVPAIRTVGGLLENVDADIVLDPVLVARDGFRYLRPASVNTLIQELLPRATLVTPNSAEAAILSGLPIASEGDAKAAARKIQSFGPRAVLIKGGHAEGERVSAGLLDGREWLLFTHPRIETECTLGTGCTLSAAITAYLALGETLPDAVSRGIAFVRLAMQCGSRLGHGQGPLAQHEAGLEISPEKG